MYVIDGWIKYFRNVVKYWCLQVYCFDGEMFFFFQFQVINKVDIDDVNCWVDCWVILCVNSYIMFCVVDVYIGVMK